MSVIKREIDLPEVLGAYLNYTPRYVETEQFRSDLRTLNHTLLRDTLLECTETERVVEDQLVQSKRQRVHSVYTRKVKELAAMYPFLFSVENALRSIATERYTRLFGNAFWWRVFTEAHTKGKTAANFAADANGKKNVHGVPVNPAFIRDVLFGVSNFTSSQMKGLSSAEARSNQFYETLTLRQLANIFLADWSISSLGELKRQDFKTHMKTICAARNEIFHGNPIKNRATVYTACERILDSIDIHMGDLDEALRTTTYVRLSPTVQRQPRHCTPPL